MSLFQVPIAKRRGSDAVRLLAMLACATALTGCVTNQLANQEVSGSVPSDYRQRHPIVLKEEPRTVELFIGSKRGTLTGAQRADVAAFAREWRREASGGILVEVPSGTPNEFAAVSAVREVRAILAAVGVPPNGINIRPHRTSDPRKLATLKISYPRIAGDVGPCGLWPHDLGTTADREHLENREYWNFGCASARNLAAMVDNPHDLVQPRGETPAYSGRRTTVLDKYHRGESTATVYPDTNKGKISDIGQ
jgi:pilus assembly protein CpaD